MKRRVLLKNTPDTNAKLWKVKHLVRITPVTFPDGEPTPEDIGSTKLTHAGEMRISSRYKIDPAELQAEDEYMNNPRRLDDRTKRKDSMRKWMLGHDLD